MKCINRLILGLGIGLFINCDLKSQTKTEILLIGSIHRIPDSVSCNWKSVYQKLLNYKPDQIAVEEIIPEDSISLVRDLGENFRKISDSTLISWEGKKINPKDSIEYYFNLLQTRDDANWRRLLWKYYHLGLDLGNRNFQTYQIFKNNQINLANLNINSNWEKFFLESYKLTISNKKNSEFFNLIYPLAVQLGIKYLYPTDNKATYPMQSNAFEEFTEELKGTAFMKGYDNFWADFNKTEAEQIRSCAGLNFVNSTAWLEKTDYGMAHILDDSRNSGFKTYAKVWYYRNESIAERIIRAAHVSQASKMVVFYGYMHVFPVKKYLESKGYKVKLLDDL